MDLLIFQKILFDSLMPWLITSADERVMLANLRTVSDEDAETTKEAIQNLQHLLAHQPDITAWLQLQLPPEKIKVQPLCYTSDLPDYTDGITKFYQSLIDLEILRVFNCFFYDSQKWVDDDILNYNTEMLLRDIKRYLNRTTNKIHELGFTSIDQKEMPFIPFVLYYLKYQLINLYSSVQEAHKEKLTVTINVQDLYLTVLKEKKSQIRDIYPTFKTPIGAKTQKSKPPRLSFGCNIKKEKLSPIIIRLCDEIQLLNEDISPADELLDLLYSRDIKAGTKKIRINCDNKNFRYIIEKLMQFFDNLTFINIERSQSFYSKKGKPIVSNDLSKARSYNPKPDPERLETYQSNLIEVNNKLDAYTKKMESEGKPIPSVSNGISAKNLSIIQWLKDALYDKALSGKKTDGAIISNVRHYEALLKTRESLLAVKSGLEQGLPVDLITIDVRRCLHYLGEITGVIEVDRDILGAIFSKFCIGR